MADGPRDYYAFDMSNGKTYIGWFNQDQRDQSYSLEDMVVVDTFANGSSSAPREEMAPKDYYIKNYRRYYDMFSKAGGLGRIDFQKYPFSQCETLICHWYLGKEIIEKNL
jgi:hypothetical protein